MSIYEKMRRQYCVYWPPGPPDNYGKTTYGTAVELKCRWVDVQKEFVAQDGTTQISSSQVFVPDKLLGEGWLWQGRLADVVDALDPVASAAGKIKAFQEIPNLKATKFLRVATLGAG